MKTVIALLLLAGLTSCSRTADFLLDPPEWNFGSIPSNYTAGREISVRNRGVRAVALRFISTCDCLHVEQAATRLAGGQTAPLRLAYDPEGQSGFVEAAMIVVARQGRRESRFAVRVYGKVLPYSRESAR